MLFRSAAGAPFRILILSISSGFRLEMPSPPSRLPALAVPPMAEYACSEVEFRMGTPSITFLHGLLHSIKPHRVRLVVFSDVVATAFLIRVDRYFKE